METPPVRILIVEDNPGDARLWRELLLEDSQARIEITHVDKLKLALDVLRQEKTDVVLLDLSLPDATGVDTVVQTHRVAPSIPLVVLTGLNDQDTALSALQKGAQDYLVKDRVDGRALWHAIRYAIERNKVDEMERQLLGAETARAHAEVGERRFRSLAEAIPQIVWEMTADGRFEYLSSRWFEYTGQTASDYTELDTREWIHPEDSPRVADGWAESTRGKQPWQLEYRLRRADGVFRWHLGRSEPQLDADGNIVKWYGTATDIDDQRRAAEERQRLYIEAQKAIKSRDDLLATVSHDLRNPLENILMSAALIKDTPVVTPQDGKLQKKVSIIERAAKRMEHLIRDLLDITSIESGHLSVSLEPNSVSGLISDAIEAMQPAALEKSVRIESQVTPVLQPVSCDRNRLVQVFINLMGNAIRFTPPAGVITISARPEGDHALFSVADRGKGIEADQLPHVFDRFWRADETARAGLGLGLAICRGIIEQHHGRIWVESERGVGTTFFFTLPLAPKG